MRHNDYILDVIEDFGTFLLKLTGQSSYHEELSAVNHDDSLGEAGLMGIMLKRMCAAGNINQAENMLFDALEEHPEPDYFFVALDFYKELASYSEKRLKECNFSKEEIATGINEVMRLAAENGVSQEQL